MPSIANSTQTLTTPTIDMSSLAPVYLTPGTGALQVLRSIVPSNDVLDTVTAQAIAQFGAQPVWKPGTLTTLSVPAAAATSTATTTPSNPTGSIGVPQEVIDVQAEQSPYKTADGTIESLVSVTYGQWANDEYFTGVEIWFTGYQGISTPQLMCTSTASPVQFTCAATKETVTVTVVAYGPSGLTASFVAAPSTTVLLSGVQNAPPAPSINQPVTEIGSGQGWQFTWNVITGMLADVISGYWVYKSAVNVVPSAPAGRVAWLAQPISNIGTLLYQDQDSATEYFWVSAVNTSGLESSLTPANVTITTAVYYPTVTSGVATSAAYDGNESTSSTANEAAYSLAAGVLGTQVGVWSAFPRLTITPSSLTLMILAAYSVSATSYYGPPAWGEAYIEYSLNGGTTWATLCGEGLTTSSVYGAPAYYSVALPTSQDTTQVQVRFTAGAQAAASWTPPPYGGPYSTNTATGTVSIYELRIQAVLESLG